LFQNIKEQIHCSFTKYVAVNKSPKVWAGSLREIHVSIIGNPNDYAVEVASGAWFGSLVWTGAVGLVFGGPMVLLLELQ
jgi:hypothetical protein